LEYDLDTAALEDTAACDAKVFPRAPGGLGEGAVPATTPRVESMPLSSIVEAVTALGKLGQGRLGVPRSVTWHWLLRDLAPTFFASCKVAENPMSPPFLSQDFVFLGSQAYRKSWYTHLL